MKKVTIGVLEDALSININMETSKLQKDDLKRLDRERFLHTAGEVYDHAEDYFQLGREWALSSATYEQLQFITTHGQYGFGHLAPDEIEDWWRKKEIKPFQTRDAYKSNVKLCYFCVGASSILDELEGRE